MNLLALILNRAMTLPTGQVIIGSLLAPNKLLCFRLLWMAKNDQQERQKFLDGKPWNDLSDRYNTRSVKKIILQYGWPGEKLVGPIGAQAAWLLVQHADHDRKFQKECLALLKVAVDNYDAQAQHLAYLTDPICVGEGVAQIYGTQWEHPIADAVHVDERRANVGLPPLAEYLDGSEEILEKAKQRKGR